MKGKAHKECESSTGSAHRADRRVDFSTRHRGRGAYGGDAGPPVGMPASARTSATKAAGEVPAQRSNAR